MTPEQALNLILSVIPRTPLSQLELAGLQVAVDTLKAAIAPPKEHAP